MEENIKKNDVNWEATGLLHGLYAMDDYDAVKGLLEQIDFSELKTEGTHQFISPAIRRIYTQIQFNETDIIYPLKRNRALTETVLSKINVSDITKDLDIYVSEFFPVSPKYLPNLDMESELLKLFCQNYIYGLIKNEVK